MKIHSVCRALTIACAGAAALSSHAAVVFSNNVTAFTAANGGLAVEGFENAVIASGNQTDVDGPLNSSTNNGVFATGSVIAGFSLSTTAGDLYVSRDFGGNLGANVSSNAFNANMNITFAPGVTAVGLDLLQWQGQDDGWAIQLFDAADVLLGTVATAHGSFIGATSDTAIARMFINKPDTGGVIDNLRFGAAGGTVPEPATVWLVAGAALALRVSSRRARAG